MNFVRLSDEINNLSLGYRCNFSIVVFNSTLSLVVCLLMHFLVFVTNTTAYIWFSLWRLLMTGVSHKTRLLVYITKGELECFLYQCELTCYIATLSQANLFLSQEFVFLTLTSLTLINKVRKIIFLVNFKEFCSIDNL